MKMNIALFFLVSGLLMTFAWDFLNVGIEWGVRGAIFLAIGILNALLVLRDELKEKGVL